MVVCVFYVSMCCVYFLCVCVVCVCVVCVVYVKRSVSFPSLVHSVSVYECVKGISLLSQLSLPS